MQPEPSQSQPPASRGRRAYNFAKRVARDVLIVCLLGLLAMMYFEESLIFFPINEADDDWQPRGMAIENVQFQAADGTRLHGWYVPHEHPRAAVLFCHGNAGNVTHRADILRELHDRTGVSVLIFDYRGFGKSEGKPNERGVLADARAARTWLAQREKIPENRVVLMGESIGGAVAVDLAVDGTRALILENTFSSLPDVAAYHYPWLPARWLMRTRLDSVSKIASYHGPLMQSHAERDRIVPIRLGQRLFDAANEPKRFTVIPSRDHNDSHSEAYYDSLAAFLDSYP